MARKPKKNKKNKGKRRSGKGVGKRLPANPAAQTDQANQLYQAGEYDKAETIYAHILKLNPSDTNALNISANISFIRKDFERAIVLWGKAVALNPGSSEYNSNLGAAYFEWGDPNTSEKYFRKALEIDPGYVNAHMNLGNSLRDQGKLEAALASYRESVRLQPDFANAHYSVGIVLDGEGRRDEAQAAFERAIEISPGHDRANAYLGFFLTHQEGRLEDALECFRKSLSVNPDLTSTQKGFSAALRLCANLKDYFPELEADLKFCFESESMDVRDIAFPAAAQLLLKYGIADAAHIPPERLSELAQRMGADELLIMYLENARNMNAEFEIVLTKLRAALLEAGRGEPQIPPEGARLAAALSIQAFINEYVFSVGPDEERKIEELRAEIEGAFGDGALSGAALEVKLLMLAMYEPLFNLPTAHAIRDLPGASWSQLFQKVLDTTFFVRYEEEAIKNEVRSISKVEDATSGAVREQYEENPFPRWIFHANTRKMNFSGYIKQVARRFSPPSMFNEPIKILVAGCGTGHQPISTATAVRSEVLAVDLSRTSLAYAIRMAQKLEVDNVEFVQGDILELSSLDERFHVIECVGVLHHMKEPARGLAVLEELLLPGGMMRLGLYSAIARRKIIKAREYIENSGLRPRHEDIRAFRNEVLMSPGDRFSLKHLADFYSLSSCRDLLFHVQEHDMSLGQVRELIGSRGLRFVDFEFYQPEHREGYAERFPDDETMTNLDN
jgi:tetratricopeptide (TPR) repeat protein/2-polyprenyl-3-methyl-5-hydroxy-6-metoxy-1,4-benzoquinol methylase